MELIFLDELRLPFTTMLAKRPPPKASSASQTRRVSAMYLVNAKQPSPAVKSFTTSIGNATTPSLPGPSCGQSVEKAAPRPIHVEAKTLLRATDLWDALEDCKMTIVGETLHFESKCHLRNRILVTHVSVVPQAVSISDLDGTAVTPKTILDVIEQKDVYYHVWVAVKRVMGERLYVLFCQASTTCTLLRRLPRSSCKDVNLLEAAMNQTVHLSFFLMEPD
jgi:hypothetical protein